MPLSNHVGFDAVFDDVLGTVQPEKLNQLTRDRPEVDRAIRVEEDGACEFSITDAQQRRRSGHAGNDQQTGIRRYQLMEGRTKS